MNWNSNEVAWEQNNRLLITNSLVPAAVAERSLSHPEPLSGDGLSCSQG